MDLAVLIYIGPLVALFGMYLCFANQPRGTRLLGALVATAGVAVTGYGMAETFHLPVAPGAAVPAAVLAVWLAGRMITHPAPVYAALYFGGVVVSTAVLVLLLTAHFLAAILVVVYAGAILVAYVFVIMLAQQAKPAAYDVTVRQPVLAVTAGAGLVVAVIWAVLGSRVGAVRPADHISVPVVVAEASPEGNVVSVGRMLFGQYPVTFEVAGVLLLVAMVGAILLAAMRARPEAENK